MPEVFSVPIFFIVFREALETVIIVSVLLAFLKQTLDGPISDPVIYRKLRNQVWWGLGLGVLVTLVIGGGLIGAFYGLGKNRWSDAEYYWEASFAIVASVIITIVSSNSLHTTEPQVLI
jgi:high-affinity iron transporter